MLWISPLLYTLEEMKKKRGEEMGCYVEKIEGIITSDVPCLDSVLFDSNRISFEPRGRRSPRIPQRIVVLVGWMEKKRRENTTLRIKTPGLLIPSDSLFTACAGIPVFSNVLCSNWMNDKKAAKRVSVSNIPFLRHSYTIQLHFHSLLDDDVSRSSPPSSRTIT